jgi:hypothetical protein
MSQNSNSISGPFQVMQAEERFSSPSLQAAPKRHIWPPIKPAYDLPHETHQHCQTGCLGTTRSDPTQDSRTESGAYLRRRDTQGNLQTTYKADPDHRAGVEQH